MAMAATERGRRSLIGFRIGTFGLMVLALIAAMVFAIGAGRFSVDVARIGEILLAAVLNPNAAPTQMDERIVLLVRLPRVLLAALSGAALAVGGAALQGVFRNPLVSPQVLGISQGAAFGGALAILFGFSGFVLLGMAFLLGLSALVMVGLLARINGRTEVITVILAGMIVGALFAALVSVVQFVADPNTSLPAIVYWLMGSFSTATWPRLWLAVPGMGLSLLAVWLLRYRLNLLALEEQEARSLGVNPDRERWYIFVAISLMTGTSVAVAGIVGWIGLVVPHAARILVGEDHRALIPASALLGAAYLTLIDTMARTLTAAEIPLGVLTALVGAPVFGFLLRRHFKETNRT
ncbi:FecCD family ABC transporter permease [Neorhizobium galegae]|uniref:Iron complex transport system permease protein n=1 Tax=Neorhizobium galegae bv. orientalis str. HAMBI 540 TaxID=1028800 RepID=A0A068SZU9_NEOGA|nr:iron ABC transporter permease [Neorhizobium galegae]MCQ1853511.1 iron ABC transporter permease [Neorhizobium galegae]CDN51354.1 Iron complex transport system permease protein [Neorhizobium galegae bv. orientalis str. HAMBI 540]CDZ49631.1 Iron(III) dicitrate transport system permease protein FecD [Neorhizobium galegae bv. orientalis]